MSALPRPPHPMDTSFSFPHGLAHDVIDGNPLQPANAEAPPAAARERKLFRLMFMPWILPFIPETIYWYFRPAVAGRRVMRYNVRK